MDVRPDDAVLDELIKRLTGRLWSKDLFDRVKKTAADHGLSVSAVTSVDPFPEAGFTAQQPLQFPSLQSIPSGRLEWSSAFPQSSSVSLQASFLCRLFRI